MLHAEVVTSLDPNAPLRRLTADEYDRMVEAGIFHEDDHLELLEGVLIAMTPQSVPHARIIQRLNRLLIRAAGEAFDVRVQMPVRATAWSVPEPDLAVVPVAETERRDSHPRRALLLIEVAASTLAYDRGPKVSNYARMRVPEYWIVNTIAEVIEVYRKPSAGRYRSTQAYGTGESVRPHAFPRLSVDVAALFR